jgi:hypothetical protein
MASTYQELLIAFNLTFTLACLNSQVIACKLVAPVYTMAPAYQEPLIAFHLTFSMPVKSSPVSWLFQFTRWLPLIKGFQIYLCWIQAISKYNSFYIISKY